MSNGTSGIVYDPSKDLDYIEVNGQKRYLASKPDTPGKFKALPKFSDHFSVMHRADWFEVNRRAVFAAFGTFDQNGHGSCVGNGWAMGMSKARVLAGMKPVLLSPAWFYSLINGNSDNGAIISDGLDAGLNVGCCTFATVGQDPIYQSRMPSAAKAEAARFKLSRAFQVNSYDEIITALLMPKPMIPVYGYQVGRSFQSFDRYGVAGHDRGPGNHCNHADGVVKLPDGRWVLDDHNSWDSSWGPFGNGRVYIDEDHLFGGGDQPDCCIIEAVIEDPQDPTIPPNYQP